MILFDHFLSFVPEIFVLTTFTVSIVLIGYRLSIHTSDVRKSLFAIVIIAVGVRLLAIFLIPPISQIKFGISFTTPSDPVAFDATARALASDSPSEWVLTPSKGYEIFLAAIYRTSGRTLLIPRLSNVLFAVLLVIYSYDLADTLYDENVANLTAIGVALFPSLILVTVRIGDDSLSILLTVLGVYYLVKGRHRFLNGAIPVASATAFIGSIVILWYARYQLTLLLVAVLACWIVFLLYRRVHTDLNATVQAAGLFAIAAVVMIVVVGKPSLLLGIDSFLDQWVENNTARAGPGLAGTIRASPTLVRGVLGTGALFLMPFPPWEVLLSRRFAPAGFFTTSSLLLYVALPLLVIGGKRSILEVDRLPDRMPVLLALGMLTVGIAVIYGGTVPRFRTQIEVFLIILATSGLVRPNDELTYLFTYTPLMIFVIMYYLLF